MWNLDFEKNKIKKKGIIHVKTHNRETKYDEYSHLTEILIKHFKSATQINLP